MSKRLIVAVFLAVVLLTDAAYIAIPERDISKMELRELSGKPRPTVNTLLDGRYFEGWEKYLSDQAPFRTQWLHSYGVFNVRTLGKPYMNGVYIGTDGQLLRGPEGSPGPGIESKVASASARAAALDRFIESYGGRFVYLHTPGKQMILKEHYPPFVVWPEGYDELDGTIVSRFQEAGVSVIDLRTMFLQRPSEGLFYKTDHHWAFEGSYIAYSEAVRHFGLTPYALDELDVRTVENPYWGNFNRKIGMAIPSDEKLEYATPKRPVPYTMTIPGKAPVPFVVIPEDPSEPIAYTAFMGGDLGETIIDTDRPELPDALLVGTSFTNAIEPLLYLNFDQIRILDLRVFKSESLYDYIDEHRPDCVMLQVNGHEILSDTGNTHFGELTGRSERTTGPAGP